MAKANAGKSMGKHATGQHGAKPAGPPRDDRPDEFEYAQDIQGKNRLHGDDQHNVRNQRQAQADARGDTDDLLESFEKLDKDVRARTDLNKGARSSKSKDR
ncbi:hypothetical protein [Pelagibacterium xiamenense]|uniref:hypothetical protein n=1 Tax=Pelagibacterium xiamenense TaxID=2901140 RepID=UPI001E547398|nr:hypothetical protein [Pelagibacterium xiamenense]MCD7059440.1 hypothetical protein [Pelagibacterium xiamenense]